MSHHLHTFIPWNEHPEPITCPPGSRRGANQFGQFCSWIAPTPEAEEFPQRARLSPGRPLEEIGSRLSALNRRIRALSAPGGIIIPTAYSWHTEPFNESSYHHPYMSRGSSGYKGSGV